jgi:hypothetical protein
MPANYTIIYHNATQKHFHLCDPLWGGLRNHHFAATYPISLPVHALYTDGNRTHVSLRSSFKLPRVLGVMTSEYG